jgi:hypothetical protein
MVHKHLGIFAGDRFIYTEKVELSSAQLDITFKKEGLYNFQFYTFSDYCNLPKEEVKMCKVFVNFKMNVTKADQSGYGIITIVILFIITILLIVLISLIIFKFDKVKKWIKEKRYVEFYQNSEVDNQYDKAITQRNTTEQENQRSIVMTNSIKP